MRFCPHCENMLAFDFNTQVQLVCKKCGYSKQFEPKTKEESLILETDFRSGSSAGGAASGISVNSYTLNDPTLPHMRGTQAPACPNGSCTTNSDAVDAVQRDVIYIKTDPTNLKFQYICTRCVTQWGN